MSNQAFLEANRVDMRAIERELVSLWQSAAESADAGHTAPVTRTCLANLVVLVGDRAGVRHATAVVDGLTAVYPNRTIVAATLHDGQGGSAIDAWVQAHCQLPAPGRPQVCGEQITIEARGAAVEHVPAMVLPLLVPDVPVAIWIPSGEPASSAVARKLADVADRLIADSATFAAPDAGLALLVSLIDADTSVSDLAWGRLTRWRELTAQFFDAPATRQHLGEIERVRIAVAPRADGGQDRTEALLLAGWLASRLGWRVEGRGAQARLLRPDGGAVQLEAVVTPGVSDQADRLVSIDIVCRRGVFSVAREPGTDVVTTRAEAEGLWPIQRSVGLEVLDDAALVAGELQLLGRDHTFESALRVAAMLA